MSSSASNDVGEEPDSLYTSGCLDRRVGFTLIVDLCEVIVEPRVGFIEFATSVKLGYVFDVKSHTVSVCESAHVCKEGMRDRP